MAEILGGAIALQMLFGISIPVGSLLVTVTVLVLLFTNSYKKTPGQQRLEHLCSGPASSRYLEHHHQWYGRGQYLLGTLWRVV
jgi:hypothetical protein